jgi:CheY-like chemotaxis protein
MSGKTILVIEDEEGIREALRLTLELEGYQVQTAMNGKVGLDLLSAIPSPCLVLLDLMMPVMDGWSFAEAIGKDLVLAVIPIVVVTAFADQGKSFKRARCIIKKPVDIDLLLRIVKQFCD